MKKKAFAQAQAKCLDQAVFSIAATCVWPSWRIDTSECLLSSIAFFTMENRPEIPFSRIFTMGTGTAACSVRKELAVLQGE